MKLYGEECSLKEHLYTHTHSLCLTWVSEIAGPQVRMSVCVPVEDGGIPLEEDEFVLNHDLNEQPFVLEALRATHLFEDTGVKVSYGYIENQPVWKYLRPASNPGE